MRPSQNFFRVLYGGILDMGKGTPKIFPDGQICAMESPMATILPFIRYDAACTEFRDTDLTNLAREVIAQRIIAAAKRGERSPQRLCNIAVAAIRGSRKAG
jgi:hypothetical protein